MKYLISFLSLVLFTRTGFCATAQVNNVLQFTGITASTGATGVQTIPVGAIDTSGFITVGGSSNGVSAGNYIAIRSISGAQYQVPSNKVFYITDVWVLSTTAGYNVSIGYGTAALGSDNTATPPTGATNLLVNTAIGPGPFYNFTGSQFAHYTLPGLTFPAASYPYFIATSATNLYSIMVSGIVK